MIIESFVKGVNAYIEKTQQNPELLPPEFEILDIKPDLWTPEIVYFQTPGPSWEYLARIEIMEEPSRALGEKLVHELSNFKPSDS